MASQEYDRINTTRINLKLNNKTDADIIEKLKGTENVQGYIKELIRNNMEEEKTMEKKYTIKPEYLDMWEGGDTPSDPDRIITQADVEYFAEEWGKTVEELLNQLNQI